MKSAALVAALLVALSSALPTPEDQASQASQAAAIDSGRRFSCPQRVNAFCHASNVHSGCTHDGTFRSDAMDTCGQCSC